MQHAARYHIIGFSNQNPAYARKMEATRRSRAEHLEVVFKGDLEEVNELFRKNVWSDGLPIMPPTRQAV